MKGKNNKIILILLILCLFSLNIKAKEYTPDYLEDESNFKSLSSADVADNANTIKSLGLDNKLTAKQLKGNLEKFDLSKLNPVEANKAINAQYGTSHNFKNFHTGSKIENNKLKISDSVIDLETFKGSHTIESINGKLYVNGKEYIGAKNVKSDGQSISIESVKSLTSGSSQLLNGVNVRVFNNRIEADYADSFIQGSSVTTNINNLNSKVDIFSVDSADSFLSDCIRVDSIKDSEFKVSSKIEITTSSDSNLKITDCSYNEFEFKGKGTISVDKSSDAPKYVIENGTLTKKDKGFNESIESNNSITIETDKTFGIKCLTITPVGSYFYIDNDLRKDFTINVPKESSTYKLCIRRDSAQQFSSYDGLINFVNKKIELNGVVNYLRYPLKNNQISSLLGKFVYKGLKDVNTMLSYDSDLIFLNNIFLVNKDNVKTNILSITYPSNYYQIMEMEFDNGIHSIIQLDLNLRKSDLTQNINYNYQTDYFQPKASIKDNVLIQNTPTQKITILTPEHEKMKEILENAKR